MGEQHRGDRRAQRRRRDAGGQGPGDGDEQSQSTRRRVGPIVADLVDALDAVGDLVLAESVHQLVGGSPLRAGIAADTLGRGGDVPDVWRCLRTPHRARALTNRMAVVLPAARARTTCGDGGGTGWPVDPLAEPCPPSSPGSRSCSARPRASPSRESSATAILHRPSTNPSIGSASARCRRCWTRRQRSAPAERGRSDRAPGGPGTPVSFAGPAWRRVHGTGASGCGRCWSPPSRCSLGTCRASRPTSRWTSPATRARLTTFAQTAVAPGDPAPTPCWRPRRPSPDDPDRGGPEGWLSTARAALAEVLGVDVPLLPALVGRSGRLSAAARRRRGRRRHRLAAPPGRGAVRRPGRCTRR